MVSIRCGIKRLQGLGSGECSKCVNDEDSWDYTYVRLNSRFMRGFGRCLKPLSTSTAGPSMHEYMAADQNSVLSWVLTTSPFSRFHTFAANAW